MPFRPVPPVHKSQRARPREGFRWPPGNLVLVQWPIINQEIVPILFSESPVPAFQNDTAGWWMPPN